MTYETIVKREIKAPFVMNDLADMYEFLTSKYKKRDEEQVVLITLGEAYHFINSHLVYLGGFSETALDIKDVMCKAITDKAKHIIIGYIRSAKTDLLSPNNKDYTNAERIFKSAKILELKVMAQLIIGSHGYTTITHDHNSPNDLIT
jgi:DNA repair protein RadC